MAEEVPTEVPVAEAAEPVAEPVADAEPAAADEPAPEPVAEAATDEAAVAAEAEAEAGQKRGREEEEADGEPEAKRAAQAEVDTAGAEAPAEPAAEPAVAVDIPQPAENGSYDYSHVASAIPALGGNDEHMVSAGHHNNPGPPPVRDGFPVTHNEDGSISEILAVSKHLVGKLIGKGGVTIQQLQATTATNIQIDQEGSEFPDAKKVTVRGSQESVDRAKAEIKKMLEEAVAPAEGEVEEKVPCPAGIVGRIIGRGGETIRSLQQASGAHILVDQNFPEGADRMVVIKGRPDCVQRAAAMCIELIKGEPGSASQIISKHGVGQTITVQCPKGIVGRIIGKGGDTIKGLQRKYHVSIQIDQGGDPMSVTITGPKHTAEACKAEVQALISDTAGPGGPPFGGRGPGFGGPRPGYGPPGYGAPAPYQVPPGAFGGYAPPYGAPYGAAPAYGAPGAYPGYPAAGGYPGYAAPAAGGYAAGGYSAAGYGGAAAGGYSQQQAGYGAATSPGAGASSYTAQQQPAYGGAAGYGGAADSSAAAAYGGAAAASGSAGGAAAGGSVWQAMNDDQGRTYYYNTQTGVSQWEKPAEMP